jgi:hypothetical protein
MQLYERQGLANRQLAGFMSTVQHQLSNRRFYWSVEWGTGLNGASEEAA